MVRSEEWFATAARLLSSVPLRLRRSVLYDNNYMVGPTWITYDTVDRGEGAAYFVVVRLCSIANFTNPTKS